MNTVTDCTPKTRYLIGNYGEPVKKVRAITRTKRILLNEQQRIQDFTGFLIIDHEGWRRDLVTLTTRKIEHNENELIVHFEPWISEAPCCPVGLALWCNQICSWSVLPVLDDDRRSLKHSFSVPGSDITMRYTLDRCELLESYIPYEDVEDYMLR